LLEQAVRLADSRADCTAGSSKPTSVPMIAITTSNSTRLNPRRGCGAKSPFLSGEHRILNPQN
jgi:hypothetical protein